jgi:tRNA-specific 2-thiouridylase
VKHVSHKTVFVGLSGGVDSSVTAALLKKAGHTVVGVFIRTWQPDFIECSFREDRLDAMRVAAHLDIPFLECDAEEAYKRAVADYMVVEYKAGRTPNPDVMCNREIKFGVFWEFAKSRGADAIATGHYARNENGALKKALDPAKDQAYFLYRLTSDDLAHVMFPLGGLKKPAVRALAKKFGLPTASKKDSQGICMLGDLDIKQFLAHYIAPEAGDVLNESGEVIGRHDGAAFLTLGERHGFTVTKKTPNDERRYIVAKDVEKNTVTLGDAKTQSLSLARLSWVTAAPVAGKKYTAQIRYHGELLECKWHDGTVGFEKEVLVAKGQSIVLYDGDVCLGGGIVE